MARNINAMAFDTSRSCASTHESFNQLTDVEEPDLDLVASKVKRSRIEVIYLLSVFFFMNAIYKTRYTIFYPVKSCYFLRCS